MARPDPDPSIEHEPFLRREEFAEDPSEARAAHNLAAESRRRGGDDLLDQSVWEEPSLALEATAPANQLPPPYAQWLDQRVCKTSTRRTWVVTWLVMLAAGPWAIFGALLQGVGLSLWGPLSIVLFGPIIEEIMKVALPLVIVERRPYLFRYSGQILACSVAGGLAFAALENVLYLFVYIPDASPSLVAVRWSVCVLVHVVCSSLAGIGIARAWSHAMVCRTRPQLGVAMAWLVTAIALHGVYNGVVGTLELFGR